MIQNAIIKDLVRLVFANMDANSIFAKYDTARSLYRELKNILLLCIHESNYYYCYCNEQNQKCTLCQFCDYFPDAKIENQPIECFIDLNRNQKQKLDLVVGLINPFYQKILSEDKTSLQFFYKEYYWQSRDIASGTIKHVSLDEIIDGN